MILTTESQKYRIFEDGKFYQAGKNFRSKFDANQYAISCRLRGYKARVIKVNNYFLVYCQKYRERNFK